MIAEDNFPKYAVKREKVTANPAILSRDLLYKEELVPVAYFRQLENLGLFINQYIKMNAGDVDQQALEYTKNLIKSEMIYIDNTIGRYYEKLRATK